MNDLTPQEMIKNLFDSGLKQTEIADETGTSQANICRIARGQIPRYDLGSAIKKLYLSQVTQPKRRKGHVNS